MFRLPSRRPYRPAARCGAGGRRLIVAPAVAVALAGAPVVLGGAWSSGLPEASAHDAMVGATPEQDSTVTEMPDSIELEFSGIPRDDFNTVALSHDGEVLTTGEPTLDGRFITLDIPSDVSATDGEYTVGYQITSSDGHATRGSYTFTLDTGSGAAGSDAGDAGETASGEESGEEQGLPSWAAPAMAVAGVIVVLGALVLAIARFRNMSSGDGSGDDGTHGADGDNGTRRS
ncbi:copper resistance CopC family protein [Corynebacterium kalidii]|uniref:Copper resistance protein CopC n=1 Tax=Corynebacterium kalidii TaxID=2931982 RepID=A0A9X1WIA2_9CORY|nr:copper resistance CopC family protein [Corynebacterium kalidii]MCJ7859594.1 copper resistance protein CopC [Corynebacterium kalidii]